MPHGIAKEDISPQDPSHLSCKVKLFLVAYSCICTCCLLNHEPSNGLLLTLKRGDVLVLVDHVDNSIIECQKGEETGKVHSSQMQIITPLDESLKSRQRV